ncbi:MAG: ATP-binding protein [Opitutaceae bacterium]|jgi:two-component system phosphate regulon sensor histidine kinase PhoR
MTWLPVLLSLLLLLAVFRIVRMELALRRLKTAIEARKPVLPESEHRSQSRVVDALCLSIRRLLEESQELRQRASGQLAQLETTLGNLQEAVLILDEHNYVLLANRALHAIFPEARDVLRQRVERALHSNEFLSYIDEVRAGSASPQQEIEFLVSSKSIWIEATGSLVQPTDGSSEAWTLFVLHDISRQKQLEAVRKDFVANVSHELRTPLSVIKGYAETLADSHRDMPAEEREQFLKIIQRHADRLHSLLEDLLTLSRLESAQPGLHRESVDVSAFISSTMEEFRRRPDALGHEFGIELPPASPQAMLDPLKLGQVFDNLLGNAVKYTPKGTRILVSLGIVPDKLELRFSDNGPGIPAADLPHVFERFYRIDKSRSRDTGGTGLGLSIVKHIIQLHGGSIRIESTLGQGTTFIITLPAS